MTYQIEDVRNYWNSHLNLTQFITSENVAIGSEEFYRALESTMERFEYKPVLLREFAQGRDGQRLLEIGCGLGVELAHLGRLGFHVTGLDLAPKAVELANLHLGRQGAHGEAVVGNAEELQFDDETFDVVYSSGVLQHTPNIERAVEELRRVLKPGGSILIILYHRRSLFYLLHRLSGFNIEFASEDAPIINAYTKSDLRELFAPFRNIRIASESYYLSRTKRSGFLPAAYNWLLVPLVGLVPKTILRNYGWHLVLRAEK